MSFPGWPFVTPDDSSTDSLAEYYLNHPNGRIISAFFLGCVFMNGLQYMTSSLFFRGALARLRRLGHHLRHYVLPRRPRVDLELPTSRAEKAALDADETAALREYNDHTALIFTLNLCFVLAGLALFTSLLAFRDQAAWDTGCAFVVAWGGMSSQLARLLGLMILTIEVNRIGVKRWELFVVWGFAFIGLALVFATNATNSGTTELAQTAGAAFCYKKRFLPTALTSSIIRLVIEVYLIIRLVALSRNRSRWLSDRAVKVVTIVRACSLLLLDLLTVVPDSIRTTIAADFLPFCVGAAIVLAAFNWKWTALHPSGTSSVQSLVFVARATADPLLVPTPFTLHFPRPYRTSAHSWSSASAHRAPASARSALMTPQRERVFDADELELAQGESAVISLATAAHRRSVRQVTLPVFPPMLLYPHSAPAQLGAFSAPATFPGGRILASQSALADRLDAEHAAQAAGPAVPRHPEGLQNTASVLRDDASDASSAGRASLASLVYGSDILQPSPRTRRADGAAHDVSPAPTQTTFARSPRDSRRSYASSVATRTSSAYSPASTATPRAARRHGMLSPLDSAPSSASSARFWRRRASRPDPELPPVREASPSPPSPSPGSARARRGTFGARRRASSSLSLGLLRSPTEPVPPLPVPPLSAVLPTVQLPPSAARVRRYALPTLAIPVPRVQVSPASPGTPALFVPADGLPAGPAVSATLQGPAPPPSAFLPGGALLEGRDAETLSQLSQLRRTNSSRSAYSQESFVSLETVTRPSMQW